MRRVLTGLLVVALAVAASATERGSVDQVVEAAPDSQRVLLVSDSVGLGTRGVLDEFFPADWEVNVIGTPAYFVEQLRDRHVAPTLAGAPWMVGDHVVIAGGYNYPFWDPKRFDRSIDSMVQTLTSAGVEHVYWVTLREVKPQFISPSAWRQVQPYYWYFPTVNEHLRKAVARHPNLTLIDWAAAADRSGITYDAIHLNRKGAELYSSLVRSAVDNARYRPADGAITRVGVTDDPAVTAVAVNLTSVGARRNGHLTAYPCDAPNPPVVSQVVYRSADVVAAAGLVPVDDDGHICVLGFSASHVVVDVTGAFTDAARLSDSAPNRVFDSRVDPGVPVGPGRFAITVTEGGGTRADGPVALSVGAVQPGGLGHTTVFPCDEAPTTVTVNTSTPGRTRTNLVLVQPDDRGEVCVEIVGSSTHLTIDRFATFGESETEPSTVRTASPERVLDTRDLPRRPAAGETVRFSLSETSFADAADVRGLAFNLGIIRPDAGGHATVWPCDEPLPRTSSINYGAGEIVSNFVVVEPDGSGEICVRSRAATDLTIDVLAALGDGFVGQSPTRVVDTRTP